MDKTITPAHRAILDAGYTIETAARALGLQVSYFKRVLTHGGLSKLRCRRAARFFGCSGDLFYHPASYYNPEHKAPLEQRSFKEQSSRDARMRRMDAVSNVAVGGDTLSPRKESPRASRYMRSSKNRRWE